MKKTQRTAKLVSCWQEISAASKLSQQIGGATTFAFKKTKTEANEKNTENENETNLDFFLLEV
jgi:hypothetical protein